MASSVSPDTDSDYPPHPTSNAPPSNSSNASTIPPDALALATCLFDSARHGQTAIFHQLLPLGLNPNMTNDKGDSLIMLASYHGHADLVKLLLLHGADPNRVNDRGQSPLAGTVFKGERDCIRLLVEDGNADPRVGEPSAIEACGIFRQEDLNEVFLRQVEKLEKEERERKQGVKDEGEGEGKGLERAGHGESGG